MKLIIMKMDNNKKKKNIHHHSFSFSLSFFLLVLLILLGCLPKGTESWIYGDVNCGCPNSCTDDGALSEMNDSPWNCYDRIHYFIGHYHLNETEACAAASKDPSLSDEDNLVRPCRPEACHPTKCTNIAPPGSTTNTNTNTNGNGNGDYNPDDPSNDEDFNNDNEKENQNAVVDAMTSTKNMRSITLGITIGLIIVFCACFLGCCNGKSFVKNKIMMKDITTSTSPNSTNGGDIRGDVGGFRDDEDGGGEDRFRDEEVEMSSSKNASKRKSPSHGYKDPLST